MNKDVLEHIEDTVRDIMPLDARILLYLVRAQEVMPVLIQTGTS